uniref:Uncharacterized protein n=1 Tax=viral metagenome TaxID=1070528 RepID=A0A6C0BQ71_9ZZZZ
MSPVQAEDEEDEDQRIRSRSPSPDIQRTLDDLVHTNNCLVRSNAKLVETNQMLVERLLATKQNFPEPVVTYASPSLSSRPSKKRKKKRSSSGFDIGPDDREDVLRIMQMLFWFDTKQAILPMWPVNGQRVAVFPHILSMFHRHVYEESLQIKHIQQMLKAYFDAKRCFADEKTLEPHLPVVGRGVMLFLPAKMLIKMSKFYAQHPTDVTCAQKEPLEAHQALVKRIQADTKAAAEKAAKDDSNRVRVVKIYTGTTDAKKISLAAPVTTEQLAGAWEDFDAIVELRKDSTALDHQHHVAWDVAKHCFCDQKTAL